MKAPDNAARLTTVWLALSALTVASWGVSTAVHHGAPADPSVAATVGVLAMALVKVRLILRHFMEVGTAPSWLRRATDAWLAVFGIAVLAVYLA